MSSSPSSGLLKFRVDEEFQRVHVTLNGDVAIEEIARSMQAIQSHPAYSESFDGLIDFREFTGCWSREEILTIANLIRANPGAPGARRAVLVKDDLQHGLMRMIEGFTFLTPVIYHTFRSEEYALAWLAERPVKTRDSARRQD